MKIAFKLFIQFFSIIPLVLIISCTSLSTKMDKISPQTEALLMAYKKGKSLEDTNPKESCYIYTQLSGQKFSLQTLSLIKAHLVCEDSKNLATLPENLNSEQPWLAGLNLDRAIAEAKRSKDNLSQANSYLKKAMWSDRIKEKVDLLEEAGKYAKLAGDDELKKDIQTRLYRVAPRFDPNPKPEDYIRLGSDLIYQRRFTEGRRYLKLAQNEKSISKDQQYLARKLRRNSYKTEQLKEEYLTAAEDFAKWTEKAGNPSRMHEAYITLARAEWTQGKMTAAQKNLDKLEKLSKGKGQIEEIYFVRAKMAEENLDFAKALELHSTGETYAKPKSAYHQRLLFSKAWVLRKLHRFPESAVALEKLTSETEDVFDRNRYKFWLAKSLRQSDREKEATNELESLMKDDSLGYYGLLAYRELGKELPPLNIFTDSLEIWNRPRKVNSEEHQYIAGLTYVDESSILERFLNAKTLKLQSVESQDEEEWLYYLKAYARAGLYNPLFTQLGNLPAKVKSDLLSQNPELLFPKRYVELIEKSAAKFEVSPELMLSIIRQESAFNPFARSPADALGLMQVIPSVAELHEQHTGFKLEHFEDLYKPEVNIPVGASVIADLKRKYRGQFLLTAAAYNANEKAIANWIRTRLDEDPLEFIEDIPYEETRAYVKLVLRNFIFYSRLKNPGESLAFPQWCLEDLQSFKVSTQ